MRDLIVTEPDTWVGVDGIVRRVSSMKKLHFTRVPAHAQLRAFVYVRDAFTCQWCGAAGIPVPDYSGIDNIKLIQKCKRGWDLWFVVDHIVSRQNGGSNHPANLQTLCYSCNSAKSGLVDSKVGK